MNFETFSELREEFLDNDDSSAENQETDETKFYNEAELLEIQSEIRLLRNFYELANSIEKNSNDQRVYELLNNKFKLFESIFGASDEVLGAISSGIDFEKRIADIYQTCRNPEEINKAFDELQSEFESSIDESFKSAKQKLLENFDEEVREKLKISKSKTENLITKYHNTFQAL